MTLTCHRGAGQLFFRVYANFVLSDIYFLSLLDLRDKGWERISEK